jgi:hypothetical protein
MRIGIICEGGPVSHQRNSTTDNPDARVIESFINLLSPGHEFVFNPLGNKPNLKAQCGRVAHGLLTIEECDIVFVFWDLYPAWSELKKDRPCQREDREAILHNLAQAGLGTNQNIFPVCALSRSLAVVSALQIKILRKRSRNSLAPIGNHTILQSIIPR